MQRLPAVDPTGVVHPLVVPTVFAEGESLLGAIAASTRANVLGTTQIILREIGLDLNHPGTVGQVIGDLVPRLAHKLGCEPTAVADRCHPHAGRDEGGAIVRYGDGTLRRSDLDLDARRISPAGLAASPYHRAAWCNRHLPYCAESLELLVDRCGACEARLRWSSGWGIGTCEACREPVAPSGERLDLALAEPYRRFADLISVVPDVRDRAREALAPQLAALSQPHLIDLILAVGTAFGTRAAPSRPFISAMDPPSRAAATACGLRLTENWPVQIRRTATELYSEVAGNVEARGALLKALRPLSNPLAFGGDVAAVMRTAIPEAFGPIRRALGGLRGPVLVARDVLVRAAIDSVALAKLDAAGLLPSTKVAVGERPQRQYEAAQVEEFARRRRGSEPVHRLGRLLGIPVYGVEQLVRAGVVTWEDLPAVLVVDPELRIVTASADSLVQALEDALRNDEPPPDAVALWTIMRRRGGGAKAWARALRLVQEGTTPAWRGRDPKTVRRPWTRRALVRPADFGDLAVGPFPTPSHAEMRLSTMLSQEDVYDLLNLDYTAFRPIIDAGVLPSAMDGRMLRIEKQVALKYATKLISAAEIAPVLGVAPHSVCRHMERHPKVGTLPGGWHREQFDRLVRGRTDIVV